MHFPSTSPVKSHIFFMGMHCVKQQMTQIPQKTASNAIVALHVRSNCFSAARDGISHVVVQALGAKLTNAQVEEEDGCFDGEDDDVVHDLDSECRLHQIGHLLERQGRPTETHAVISEDPYRNEIADCECLGQSVDVKKCFA